jgi:hypothetical protein
MADPMGPRLMMIHSSVTCRRSRLGKTELDFCRSRQQSGIYGTRPKTHRPGMEPRNRGRGAPPRPARDWTVENRRMDSAGRVVVHCILRCARFLRAVAAMSPPTGVDLSTGLGLPAASQRHDICRPAGGLPLQSPLDSLNQSVRPERLFKQHIAAGFILEPGDVCIACTK